MEPKTVIEGIKSSLSVLWNVFGEFFFRLFKEFFNAITLWKIEPTRSSFIKPDVRWDPFIAELFRIIVVALLALMYGGITNHKKGLQRNVSSAKGMKLLRMIFKRIFCGNYCLCTPWLGKVPIVIYLDECYHQSEMGVWRCINPRLFKEIFWRKPYQL